MIKKEKSVLKNLLVIGFSAFLAYAIFVVVRDPQLFQINILSIADQSMLDRFQWDIWYKTQSGFLDVHLSHSLSLVSVEKLVINLNYDSDNLVFDLTWLNYQWAVSYKKSNEWYLFSFVELWDIKDSESLFVLWYIWNLWDVLLWDVYIVYKDWVKQYLSVGYLESKTEH